MKKVKTNSDSTRDATRHKRKRTSIGNSFNTKKEFRKSGR